MNCSKRVFEIEPKIRSERRFQNNETTQQVVQEPVNILAAALEHDNGGLPTRLLHGSTRVPSLAPPTFGLLSSVWIFELMLDPAEEEAKRN